MKFNDVYCYSLYSPGKWYPKIPEFICKPEEITTGFSSLYSVDEFTAHALVDTGTIRGFKGIVWSDRLWLDFDTQEAGKEALNKIKERTELNYVCYSSGGRGLHIGILRDSNPSHLLPLFDKKWTEKTFEGHDPSIYSHLHLFRLPGTIHEKTGLKKELIEVGGKESVQVDFSILENEKQYDYTENKVYGGDRSIFDSKSIMYNSTPQDNGQRHEHLVRCLYALKSSSVSVFNARWWVGEVNKTYNDRKSEESLDQLVRSIYG